MEIPALHRSILAENIPLERLAENKALSEADKIDEAARQFEAMLLRRILGDASKQVISSSLHSESSTTSIYRDMINDALADNISQSRAIGLSDALTQQLGNPASGAIFDPGC